MRQVIVYYNPFLPELKIAVDGRPLSRYSSLMSLRHERLEVWSDCLFADLYREVNSEYEMLCVSDEFACEWLEELARRDPHCLSFSSQPLPMSANVYERLDTLERLGCDEADGEAVIPVFNASHDDAMTSALFGVLEEQGVFEDVSEDGVTWTDCPLTTVAIRPCGRYGELPDGIKVAIALCGSPDDYVSLNTDVPVYALVMGAETRFLRQQGTKLFFSVDPDDIGRVLLGIIEEEALCPLLSDLSCRFPEAAKEFLTDAEKEELEMICEAWPVCRVTIPRLCDVGRPAALDVRVYPSGQEAGLRVVSDEPDVVETESGVLYPRAAGEAEISVYLGDDPYPAASEIVTVRQRTLLSDIVLFPSALYLPAGGESELTVTLVPENAENADEIRWESSDDSVASVDGSSGKVVGLSCGRCTVTAYTPDLSKSVRVEVQPDIEDIVLPSGFLDVGVGEQKPWQYQVVPENAYGKEFLKAVSSNTAVAEYRGGYVIGKNAGDCRIIIRNQDGSITRELKVSVKKNRKFW